MKKKKKFIIHDFLSAIIVSILIVTFLKYPKLTSDYAYVGLKIWFDSMIISLFPMMVLVNILRTTELYKIIMKPLTRLLHPIFHLPTEGIFIIFFGFLAGFPLGAKLTCQLYEEKKISKQMAEYLLAFVNNLGPAYFSGFVLVSVLSSKSSYPVYIPYFIMYGIPLLYGIVLRYTYYHTVTEISALHHTGIKKEKNDPISNISSTILSHIPKAIQNSCEQMTILGGYMIICNALRTPFAVLFQQSRTLFLVCNSLLEISGGLKAICTNCSVSRLYPVFVFALLSFGGICCFLQTASLLTEAKLSPKKYMLHKMILCSITSIVSYIIYLLLG